MGRSRKMLATYRASSPFFIAKVRSEMTFVLGIVFEKAIAHLAVVRGRKRGVDLFVQGC